MGAFPGIGGRCVQTGLSVGCTERGRAQGDPPFPLPEPAAPYLMAELSVSLALVCFPSVALQAKLGPLRVLSIALCFSLQLQSSCRLLEAVALLFIGKVVLSVDPSPTPLGGKSEPGA